MYGLRLPKTTRRCMRCMHFPKEKTLPSTITWKGNEPKGAIRLIKGNRKVKHTCKNGIITVELPKELKNEPIAFYYNRK